MEQFSLEKWLQDKSRKVVTRDGRSVNIIYDHMKGLAPIIALIQWNENDEHCFMYNSKGRCASNEATLDLFFADEEEELTEFEKELEMMMVSFSNSNVGLDIRTKMPKDKLHDYAHRLIDFARKELQPEFDKEMDKMLAETDKVVYQKGREDALKSLDKREMVSEDLEEACDNYYDETWDEHGGIAMVVNNCHDIWFPSQATRDFFKAGAKWQKQQMMKDVVEGEVVYKIGNAEIAPTDVRYKVMSDRVYIPNVKLGDKVKIIICKTEQQ